MDHDEIESLREGLERAGEAVRDFAAGVKRGDEVSDALTRAAMIAEDQRAFDRREQAVNGVARAMCAAYYRGRVSDVPEGTAKESAITRYTEVVWPDWVPAAGQLLARVDCTQHDDRHHAEILATRLDEQGCTADAELLRRLAGLR